jgi:hypothetical protein
VVNSGDLNRDDRQCRPDGSTRMMTMSNCDNLDRSILSPRSERRHENLAHLIANAAHTGFGRARQWGRKA